MSLNTRIKERREQLGLSRAELAKKIGVTPSAIANYENSISSPKIELMYKLFDALQCDANYLHQDEMKKLGSETPTLEEMNHIKKYRTLDQSGKDTVDIILDTQYKRCNMQSGIPTIEEQMKETEEEMLRKCGGIVAPNRVAND